MDSEMKKALLAAILSGRSDDDDEDEKPKKKSISIDGQIERLREFFEVVEASTKELKVGDFVRCRKDMPRYRYPRAKQVAVVTRIYDTPIMEKSNSDNYTLINGELAVIQSNKDPSGPAEYLHLLTVDLRYYEQDTDRGNILTKAKKPTNVITLEKP